MLGTVRVTGRVSVPYCRAEWGTVLQDGCPYFTVGRFGVLCYRLQDGSPYFTVGRSGVLFYRMGVRTLLYGGLGYCVTGRVSVPYCRAEWGTVLQDVCPYFTVGRSGVLCYKLQDGSPYSTVGCSGVLCYRLQDGCPYFTVGRSGVLCYRTGVHTLL